jgi:ADP-heptose:LPS heptosyltransferase
MARASVGGPGRHDLPEEPRVLVIATGSVRDLLAATPVLRAVREARPGADVTVMVSPPSARALAGNPHVDRLLVLSERERRGFFGLMRLASWIRSRAFDAALVFDAAFPNALAAAMGAVPLRAGFAGGSPRFVLPHRVPRGLGEIEDRLEVARLVGVPPAGREPEMHLPAGDRGEAIEEALRALETA